MSKYGNYKGGTAGKVQQAKFEAQVKAEIKKQIDKVKAKLKEEYDKRLKIGYDAVRRTYEQYQIDCAAIALNELGWGETRISRFFCKWDEVYNAYIEAMTELPEADYKRDTMDARLQRISVSQPIKPFIERYEFLPEIKYDIDTEG